MATLTLSKSSSKYSIDVEYYGQVEKNVGSVRIGLYFRDVAEINTTVGSHLNLTCTIAIYLLRMRSRYNKDIFIHKFLQFIHTLLHVSKYNYQTWYFVLTQS